MKSDWYIIQTNPRCEDRACASLRRAGFGTYLPTMRIERQHRRTKQWIQRTLPLMPRYVFVDMGAEPDWFTLRRCDGVKSILGVVDATGETVPFPVPSRAVERMMAMQADMEFDDTRAAKVRRREIGRNRRETITMRFPVGSKVRAKDGPFATFHGHVTNVTAKGEVEIMITFLGQLSPVTFPADWLEPIAKSRVAA